MKCKACKHTIDDDSIFCKYCGVKQLRERKKKEISVPAPIQLADGTWTGQLMVKGKRAYVPAQPTKAMYMTAARAYKAELFAMADKPETITLAQAIDKYIEEKAARLKSTTRQNYEYIRNNRFPKLMQMKIGEITAKDVDAAVEAELRRPSRKGGTVSAQTVNDAYHLIATVLGRYASLDLKKVDTPEEQRSFRTVLPPEQIYPAIKGTDIELPCLLAMWLGMSASEIRGLTKSRSIRNGQLYIVETVVSLNSGDERRQGGKEETRPRVYNIPPYLMQLIDAVEGDVIEPRTAHALNQRLQTEINRAGLPHITFHSLRHTAASVMAEENIPTIVSQERGGWKTDSTMKKVYQHTFEQSRLEADRIIDARFEKIIGGIT